VGPAAGRRYRSIAAAAASECRQCYVFSVRRQLNADLFHARYSSMFLQPITMPEYASHTIYDAAARSNADRSSIYRPHVARNQFSICCRRTLRSSLHSPYPVKHQCPKTGDILKLMSRLTINHKVVSLHI